MSKGLEGRRNEARPNSGAGGPVSRTVLESLQSTSLGKLAREARESPTLQRRAAASRPNGTGLPDRLKANVENLSGVSLDDVTVHFNSDKPSQLQALAFAQGSAIHIGRGQERHLPHEAWHVAQQKQGRVRSTGSVAGVPLNDDNALEREADRMGTRAATGAISQRQASDEPAMDRSAADPPVQRAVGFEFQLRNWQFFKPGTKKQGYVPQLTDPGRGQEVASGSGWRLESDGGEPEYIISHQPEDKAQTLANAVRNVVGRVAALNDSKNRSTSFPDKGNLSIAPKEQPGENPITADAQITGGIRFERLSTMIALLSSRVGPTSLSKANEHLMRNVSVGHYKGDDVLLGSVQAAVRAAIDRKFFREMGMVGPYADDAVREHVVGLLALIASYLAKAKASRKERALMKDFPLLLKSNFAISVTNSPLRSLPGLWLNDTGAYDAAAMLKDAIMDASDRSAEEFVYPTGEGQKAMGPTVGAWIDGLFQVSPIDRMSAPANAEMDSSMGLYNRVDAVGKEANRQPPIPGAPAPIMEFRRINPSMPYIQWLGFATSAHAWIGRLNQLGTKPEDLDYKPPV